MLFALVTITAGATRPPVQAFRVVAHPETSVASLPAATLSKLFLRQIRTIPGGVEAQPVDLPVASPTRAAFSSAVHTRSIAQIERYWQGQIFAGGVTPPPRKRSDDEVLAFVRTTPGAIGYVSASADLTGVKAITVQ